MCGDEIEKLDYTRGINSFVTAEAGCCRALRIAHVDQSDRELILGELLVGEAIDRGLRSSIDEIL